MANKTKTAGKARQRVNVHELRGRFGRDVEGPAQRRKTIHDRVVPDAQDALHAMVCQGVDFGPQVDSIDGSGKVGALNLRLVVPCKEAEGKALTVGSVEIQDGESCYVTRDGKAACIDGDPLITGFSIKNNPGAVLDPKRTGIPKFRPPFLDYDLFLWMIANDSDLRDAGTLAVEALASELDG